MAKNSLLVKKDWGRGKADGNGSLWDSIEQRSPWAVLLGLCESFFKPTKTKN